MVVIKDKAKWHYDTGDRESNFIAQAYDDAVDIIRYEFDIEEDV